MRAGFLCDRQTVGDEQEIEFAAFGGGRLLLVMSEAGAGIDVAIGMAPVVPRAAHAVQDEA